MTMDCTHIQEWMLDYIYDELDGGDKEQVDDHVRHCDACRNALTELQKIQAITGDIPLPVPPDHFDDAILSLAHSGPYPQTDLASVPVRPSRFSQVESFWVKLGDVLFRPPVAAALVTTVIVVAVFTGDFSLEEPLQGASGDRSVNSEQSGSVVPETTTDGAVSQQTMPKEGLDTATAAPRSSTRPKDTEKSGMSWPSSTRLANTLAKTSEDKSPSSATASDDVTGAKKAHREQRAARSRSFDHESHTDALPHTDAPVANSLSSAPVPVPKSAPKRSDAQSEASSRSAGVAKGPRYDESAEISSVARHGVSAFNRGDFTGAIRFFEQALKENDTTDLSRADIVHYLARSEKNKGRCARALTHYTALLRDYPRYSRHRQAVREAAACYRRVGQPQAADRLLEQIGEISSSDSESSSTSRP